MSLALPDTGDDRMAGKNGSGYVFEYEARREGRTVAVLRGVEGLNGAITVQTEVYPVTAHASADPQVRPYAFPSRELANRFVDEALMALEYLGCTLAH